jgi:hypothetical protein
MDTPKVCGFSEQNLMITKDIIAAVSRGVMATLADGTLRVKIDIEPADAEAAFKILGMPGSPIAIARLETGTATATPTVEATQPEDHHQPKGGPLAKLAGQLCHQAAFCEWLCDAFPSAFQAAVAESSGNKEEAAAIVIRKLCGVESRAEIDSNQEASTRFHRLIRIPYATYQAGS